MNLSEAASMCRDEMNTHGLGHWIFQWDRSKRRFGQCRSGSRTISMSEVLTRLNDRADVLDTIRHEIAHALAGHAAGHGPLWKAKCREVGANPERCFDGAAVATPPAPWLGVCEHCGPVDGRHRRPKTMTGYIHKRCGGAITFQANHEGWTLHKEAVMASEQRSEAKPEPKRPTLDAEAQARVGARAAARAAEIARRLGRG